MVELDAAFWQSLLEESLEGQAVPGAALGIAFGDERVEAAAGTLNVATQVPATPDSLFQIGSISKPFTAFLLFQLAEEGRLSLEQTVGELLPELALVGGPTIGSISVRQLLSHTSGLQGDYFIDTGRGDDALELYARELAALPLLSPSGLTMSYCNAGFSLAARIIEHVTGQVWDRALADRLCDPAGLVRTVTLPEEALRHRVAWGHVTGRDGNVRLTPIWTPPRAVGPAGLICATAGDVLSFGLLNLARGASPGGTRLLSEESVAMMLEPQVELPEPWTMGSRWSLGWALSDWNGLRVFGHNGDGNGYSAYLHVLPDRALAFVLLTNHIDSGAVYKRLVRQVFGTLANVEPPHLPTPPESPLPVNRDCYVGTYRREGCDIEVRATSGGLRLQSRLTGGFARWFGPQISDAPIALLDSAREQFVALSDDGTPGGGLAFMTGPDGRRYIHYGMRASPMTDPG